MLCKSCSVELPYSRKPNMSGLCRRCYQRAYSKANRERKSLAARRRWVSLNPHLYNAKCVVCSSPLPVRRKYDLCLRCRNRKWRVEHREHLREKQRERYRTDVEYRLRQNIRSRIKDTIKKNKSVPEYIGCSIEELKAYLESKFQPGMTWDNYGRGGWHIDHIRPLSSFNLSDPEQLRLAYHYTNLQPLWAKDNLTKGARYEVVQADTP